DDVRQVRFLTPNWRDEWKGIQEPLDDEIVCFWHPSEDSPAVYNDERYFDSHQGHLFVELFNRMMKFVIRGTTPLLLERLNSPLQESLACYLSERGYELGSPCPSAASSSEVNDYWVTPALTIPGILRLRGSEKSPAETSLRDALNS